MEAHEWGGSAPPRGDQGTGTQGSPIGRRSRLVDGDREFRVAGHPQVPNSGLAPCKPPTGKMASEQQSVPPLISPALRGMPHHATELGSTLRVLHSDIPVFNAAILLRQRAGLSYSRLTCLPLEFVVRTQSPAVPSKSSEFQSKKRVFFARIPGCQLSQAVESRKHVR